MATGSPTAAARLRRGCHVGQPSRINLETDDNPADAVGGLVDR